MDFKLSMSARKDRILPILSLIYHVLPITSLLPSDGDTLKQKHEGLLNSVSVNYSRAPQNGSVFERTKQDMLVYFSLHWVIGGVWICGMCVM